MVVLYKQFEQSTLVKCYDHRMDLKHKAVPSNDALLSTSIIRLSKHNENIWFINIIVFFSFFLIYNLYKTYTMTTSIPRQVSTELYPVGLSFNEIFN